MVAERARRATLVAHGIRGIAPPGNARIRWLLPDYRFRLRVLRKGRFFSILLLCTVVTRGPAEKLERLARKVRLGLTMWTTVGYL